MEKKVNKEEKVCAVSSLLYQASQGGMSLTKCPATCSDPFTLHANITPALLPSHAGSFAPL